MIKPKELDTRRKGKKKLSQCQSCEEAGRRGRWYGVAEIRTAFVAGFIVVPKRKTRPQSLLTFVTKKLQ